MEKKQYRSGYPSPLDSLCFPMSSSNSRDEYLKQVNKLSHNISKHNNTKKHSFNSCLTHTFTKQHTLPDSEPRVYNITKTHFRDMVQKLTGHTPQSKPAASSSRLNRLRPPPLPHVLSHRPPPNSASVTVLPASPLPPFPTVHAESPVSAYMRFLRNSAASSSDSPVSFGCFSSLAVPLSPTGWRDL